MILKGKAEVTGEKLVPVPLCPTQIPHGLVWEKMWSFQVQTPATNRLSLRVKVTIIRGELTGSWEQRTAEYACMCESISSSSYSKNEEAAESAVKSALKWTEGVQYRSFTDWQEKDRFRGSKSFGWWVVDFFINKSRNTQIKWWGKVKYAVCTLLIVIKANIY